MNDELAIRLHEIEARFQVAIDEARNELMTVLIAIARATGVDMVELGERIDHIVRSGELSREILEDDLERERNRALT